MDEVASALDALAGEDLHALPAEDLLERTADLVTLRNRIDAELARTVRIADGKQAFAGDGMATAQAWLRGHGRLARAAASQVVRNGRALELLPAVAAAHAAGALTGDQVAVLGQLTQPRHLRLIAEADGDLAGIAQQLVTFALGHAHAELDDLVHAFLERLDADGPEPDPTEQRSLTFTRRADGRLFFRGELDAVGGERFQAAIIALEQAHRPAGDERSLARRQADAAVQLADLHLGCGTLPLLRTVKPQVAVTVHLADLLDPATGRGAARTGFGAVLSAARARWAACDADLTRIVLGPHGEPLDLGRTRRLVTPALRQAVIARDTTCVFAGCDAPHWWSEVHHVVHWALGGETSLDNSGLLCERHHTQVHHGFRIERDTAGRWHTYRPDGTEILVIRPPADDPHLARAG
ncbi:DUF222 domain-containing protein [Geodermatophilus sp. SYSU D00691]